MDITVMETDGLPKQAFLSVRSGDTKRLRPFRPGESFSFSKSLEPGGFVQFDVYERLGSQMVTGLLAEMQAGEAVVNSSCGLEDAKELIKWIKIPASGMQHISAKLKVAVSEQQSLPRDKALTRHKLALDAKQYLDNDVWGAIQGMLHALLKLRPEDPLAFMVDHLTELQNARSCGAADKKIQEAECPLPPPPPPPQEEKPELDTEQEVYKQCTPVDVQARGSAEDVSEKAQCAPSVPQSAPAAQEQDMGQANTVATSALIEELSALSAIPGLGETEYPGFPTAQCPEEMPDLSGHHNIMADLLRRDGHIYINLRRKRSVLGVPLARCIKPGFDNAAHPMLKTVGAVAGDADCYETFRELFDPIIEARHGRHVTSATSTPVASDSSSSSVSDLQLDPTGNYAMSVRVRSSRGIGGFCFPPACDRQERKEVERLLTQALLELKNDFGIFGEYYPLRGSSSCSSKPLGMSEEEEDRLRDEHILFQEPDSSVVLSSGIGRHWPEARGVFASTSRDLVAWINEEDHLRLHSMQRGGDIRQAFDRHSRALRGIEASLRQSGHSFASNERLGYLVTCPTNVGIPLCASVLLRLPLLSHNPRFLDFCRSVGLQARSALLAGVGHEQSGMWDLSHIESFQLPDTRLVDKVIVGCNQLVAMEQALERGEDVTI